jgi:hypothetical protein
MFPWFSSLLNEATKRTSVQDDHAVFAFEKLGKDLFPQYKILFSILMKE